MRRERLRMGASGLEFVRLLRKERDKGFKGRIALLFLDLSPNSN